MIVCGECGTRNAAGTRFCTVCGNFLEWGGTPTPAADDAATVPGTEEPESTGTTTAASTVSGAPAAEGKPAVHGKPVVEGKPVVDGTSVVVEDKPVVVEEKIEDKHVVEGAKASSAAEPEAVSPSVVRPGDHRPRYHAAPTGDAPAWGPSDVVCPHCGVGNAADRRFCRSCAGMLTVQAVAPRRSWWRRLLDAVTRRRTHEAGTRRRLRSSHGRLRSLGIVVVVLAALVAALSVLPTRGWISRGVTSARDRFNDHVRVTPVAVRASSAARGAAARNVSDGVSNHYWAPARDPIGAWVEVDLPKPARLLEVLVTPGVSKDKELFMAQGRPRQLDITVTDKDGHATRSTMLVQDKAGDQRFGVKVSDAVHVRFTIVSTYGTSRGKQCAIGELEFVIRG